MDTADLIRLRALQFDRRSDDIEEARLRMRRKREESNLRHNMSHAYRMRKEALQVGDLVLLDNTQKRKDFGKKLNFQWRGPYRIIHANTSGRGSYYLAELDGAKLNSSFRGTRLQKFNLPMQREGYIS